MARIIGNSSKGRPKELGLMNRMVVSAFISIMFAYSARKNKTNGPAAYST